MKRQRTPQVLSIKITIYRLASSSKIAQALYRAAENGKEVLVLMELRARFDKKNNFAWAKMLEESGCQVIYGTEGFKCHSKICLMTRNLNRRVVSACPVRDALLREQLGWILDSQLRDTAKASLLLPDGSYCRKHSAAPFDSQDYFMQQSPHTPAQPVKESPNFLWHLKKLTECF